MACVTQRDGFLYRMWVVARDEHAVPIIGRVAAPKFLDHVGLFGAVFAQGSGGEGMGGHPEGGGPNVIVLAGLLEGVRVDLDQEFVIVEFGVFFHVDDALDGHLGFLVAPSLLGGAENGDGAGDGGD